MIVPMHKYYFLVFSQRIQPFLESIQKLGVVHIIEKEVKFTNEIEENTV